MHRLTRIAVVLLCSGSVISFSGQGVWERVSQPTTKDLLRISFLDSLHGWAVGREGVIVTTTDGGTSWTKQTSGIETDIRNVFMLNSRNGWALSWVPFVDTMTFYGTILLKTTNGGTTWQNEEFQSIGVYFHRVVFLDSLHGWLGGERGSLFQTADGGRQWDRARVDSSFYAYFPILNLQFFSRDTGFAMGGAFDFVGVVWKTTNGGEVWTANAVSPEPVYAMHFVDSVHIVGIVGDFDFGASMIHTKDGGETWTYTYLGIFGQPRTMTFRTPNEGWVPAGGRFIVTVDTGRTWQIADTLSGRSIFDAVFTDSLTGFAVTDSGMVFKYDNRITGVRDFASFPNEPQLLHCYPNPFNPATTISYQLPSTRFVSIKVFDILGREISTLVNATNLPGNHTIVWEPKGISGGLYFCVMRSGSYVYTQKVVLLR